TKWRAPLRSSPLRSSPRRSQPRRSRWSQGRRPRGMRASKARAGLRVGQVCHRRWNAYGKHLPLLPEVGAVCGKAACTDLCGGREVTRVPTAKSAIAAVAHGRNWHRPTEMEPIGFMVAIEETADIAGYAPVGRLDQE